MSNPLDPMLETLKTATPGAGAVERAVIALHRPHPPRLIPLAVGVAAVSIFVLWPRGDVGVAWAQIAAQSLPLRYHEKQVVIAGGKTRTMSESWVDRASDSTRTHFFLFRNFPEQGKSVASNPLDREFEWIESPHGVYNRQGHFATFTRKPRQKSEFDPRLVSNFARRTGLERLLADKKARQLTVERNVATRVGKADRYVIAIGSENPITVYVQSGAKRILGYDSPEVGGDAWQRTFEYPDRFSRDVFAIPRRNGTRVYYLDALNAKVEAQLKKPGVILRAGGQTSVLRLVAQDERKNLWIFWSGARPNGDLKQKVQVLGMANGTVQSSLLYVSKEFGGRHSRFGGHAVHLNRLVDRVSLQIPVFTPGRSRSLFVGYATVRNVPVLHLPFVSGLESVDRSEAQALGTARTAKP